MNQNAIISALLLASVHGAAAEAPVHIAAHSTKPMKDICDQIIKLFHWRITYEDAPVLDMREVVQEKAPSGVPWLLMRAVPIEFDLPPMLDESVPEYRRKVMDTAVDAYSRSGNRAAFRYSDDGDYIHVVPKAVAGPDGQLKAIDSILNAPVTIKLGKYTVRALVEQILAQVGNRTGATISLWPFPRSFNQIILTEEADNEPAREVLIRMFDRQNGPRLMAGVGAERLFWRLTYTANGPQYFFDVDVLPAELDAATLAQRSRTGDVPADAPNAAGNPRKKGTWAGQGPTPPITPDPPKH